MGPWLDRIETFLLDGGIALLTTGLALMFGSGAEPVPPAAQWITAIGVGVLALNFALLAGRRVYERRHPPLPPKEPAPELTLWSGWLMREAGPRGECMALILFAYNSAERAHVPPARVVAHATYTDTNHRSFQLTGRWGDEKPPDVRHPTPIEIASGITRTLDLAVQHGDGFWYAVDDESARSGRVEDEHRLYLPLVVDVHLIGNVDQRVIVTLREENKGWKTSHYVVASPEAQRAVTSAVPVV